MQNSPATQMVTGKIGGSSLRSKLPNLLLGLIIFFSATQLGLHFWPLSSLVYGIRIDYLAPTVYLFDLLLLGYLVARRSDLLRKSWLSAKMFSRTSKTNSETRSDLFGTLIPILLVNLLYSQNPLATLSWSLHLILYCLFLAILGPDLKGSTQPADSKAGRSDPKGVIFVSLSLSLLFQSLLAAAQVTLGHSLGGLLYYLGERTIAVGQPAVALGTFMNSVVLRAYGTFGHPNVLAGWSVVALLITIQLRKQRDVRRSDLLRRSWPTAKMFSRISKTSSETRSDLFGIYFPLLLTTLIIFLTQSRSAALALFGFIIPFYLIKKLKFRLIYFSIFFCSLFYVLPTITPPRADLSMAERLTLQGVSLSVVRAFSIFGTGAQASISTYPAVATDNRLLQPDHNSFTLFLSWFGIFGILAIIYILKNYLGFRIWNLGFLIPLLPLLFLDHYFLTSPQGLFIFLLYVQVALHYFHAQKNL